MLERAFTIGRAAGEPMDKTTARPVKGGKSGSRREATHWVEVLRRGALSTINARLMVEKFKRLEVAKTNTGGEHKVSRQRSKGMKSRALMEKQSKKDLVSDLGGD